MPSRQDAQFPRAEDDQSHFESKNFCDERIDGASFHNLRLEFCTLEKMVFRNAKFYQCTFKHCEFIDCYLVGAEFSQCDFTGSYLERCNFTWATFPQSKMDYTRFWRCAPVLMQIESQKPNDPQAAAKFFRNLAVEHKNLGNWQEVDRLVRQSYKERERHYRFAATGKNDFYKTRYGGTKRFNYALRYIGSRLNGIAWSYGTSWASFSRSFLFLGIVLFPFANAVLGHLSDRSKIFWTQSPIQDILRYIGLIYKATFEVFLPFLPSNIVGNTDMLVLPPWLTIPEAVIGTLFTGLLISLLFKSAAKGS